MELIGLTSAFLLIAAAALAVISLRGRRREAEASSQRANIAGARALILRKPRDEAGLSTIEWMLIVAAVGGLATLGILVIRNALGSPEDMEDNVEDIDQMAAADIVSGITTKRECESSDLGGQHGVRPFWDANNRICRAVPGANTNAAKPPEIGGIDINLRTLLEGLDQGSRSSEDTRGCAPGENADGFFPVSGMKVGQTFAGQLASMGTCTFSSGPYQGFTPKGATPAVILSVVRCAAGGDGTDSVCPEDSSETTGENLKTRDGACTAMGSACTPSNKNTLFPTVQQSQLAYSSSQLASTRDQGGGVDTDIQISRTVRLGASAAIICSGTGVCESAAPDEAGLYKVTIQVTLEKSGVSDKTYTVTDFVYVRN